MKKLLPVLLILALALTACGPAASRSEPAGARETVVVTTTYPVYLFAEAVTRGVADYDVRLMIDQPVSCLHDYTLTVTDMRTLESADLLVISGAGLEETMEDALDTISDTPVIDCSAGVELLAAEEHSHEAHDHEEEASGHDHHEGDPHIWMDPRLACAMLDNLAEGLSAQDPDHADAFRANAQDAEARIMDRYAALKAQLSNLSPRALITFHDGFGYFARAFDLTILRAIEEEAGSEASARDVVEIVELVKVHSLPAIFTEVNGSAATAELISRECGADVVPLDLIMSRNPDDGDGVDVYLTRLAADVAAIQEAYS